MKVIVQQALKFRDGSKIGYATSPNGEVRRVIDYAATKDHPAEHEDHAGKYYFLKVLNGFRDIGKEIYSELEYICNKTTAEFDMNICREICQRIEARGFFEQAEVFFCAIYLEMVDYEATKLHEGRLDKNMVLMGCKAVLLDNVFYRRAANLYTNDEYLES